LKSSRAMWQQAYTSLAIEMELNKWKSLLQLFCCYYSSVPCLVMAREDFRHARKGRPKKLQMSITTRPKNHWKMWDSSQKIIPKDTQKGAKLSDPNGMLKA
jgi:hypothetical protein